MSQINTRPISSGITMAQAALSSGAPTGTKIKLSSAQISHARVFLQGRAMPANHLEQVVFIKGMKGHGWIVEKALENGNPAITRGNTVYVREDRWEFITSPNNEVFWSEIAHTSQYQQGNFESYYLSGMVGSLLIGGDGHTGNIMETIAHKRLGEPMAQAWNKAH